MSVLARYGLLYFCIIFTALEMELYFTVDEYSGMLKLTAVMSCGYERLCNSRNLPFVFSLNAKGDILKCSNGISSNGPAMRFSITSWSILLCVAIGFSLADLLLLLQVAYSGPTKPISNPFLNPSTMYCLFTYPSVNLRSSCWLTGVGSVCGSTWVGGAGQKGLLVYSVAIMVFFMISSLFSQMTFDCSRVNHVASKTVVFVVTVSVVTSCIAAVVLVTVSSWYLVCPVAR